MAYVLDASLAAAWFLPDEASDAADRLLADILSNSPVVPSLFRHELRNLLLFAERRNRLTVSDVDEALVTISTLPIAVREGDDREILNLARRHALTAYDAAYLALALAERLPARDARQEARGSRADRKSSARRAARASVTLRNAHVLRRGVRPQLFGPAVELTLGVREGRERKAPHGRDGCSTNVRKNLPPNRSGVSLGRPIALLTTGSAGVFGALRSRRRSPLRANNFLWDPSGGENFPAPPIREICRNDSQSNGVWTKFSRKRGVPYEFAAPEGSFALRQKKSGKKEASTWSEVSVQQVLEELLPA